MAASPSRKAARARKDGPGRAAPERRSLRAPPRQGTARPGAGSATGPGREAAVDASLDAPFGARTWDDRAG